MRHVLWDKQKCCTAVCAACSTEIHHFLLGYEPRVGDAANKTIIMVIMAGLRFSLHWYTSRDSANYAW